MVLEGERERMQKGCRLKKNEKVEGIEVVTRVGSEREVGTERGH